MNIIDKSPEPFVIRGQRDIARFLRRSKNEVARLIQHEGLPVVMENNAYVTTSRLLLEWQEDRCKAGAPLHGHGCRATMGENRRQP